MPVKPPALPEQATAHFEGQGHRLRFGPNHRVRARLDAYAKTLEVLEAGVA